MRRTKLSENPQPANIRAILRMERVSFVGAKAIWRQLLEKE